MPNTAIDLIELLSVPDVDPYGRFDFSPDGEYLAFAWNRSGRWEIYELAWQGLPWKGQAEPRQISAGPGAKFAPRYSPDGRSLAYVLDVDGGEEFDIWLYDRETGERRNLTPGTPQAIQPSLSWSPDGSQIACIANLDGVFKTCVLDVSVGTGRGFPGRIVLDQPYPGWEVHWSPDGRFLAVTVEGRAQDYWTFLAPAAGGEPIALESKSGPVDARAVRWSPDGGRLAFSSNTTGRLEIGIYELESGAIRWVTGGAGENDAPAWSPDGHRLVYVHAEGEDTCLAVLELESGRLEKYRLEPGVHYVPEFTPDGEQVAFVFDNPRRPDDLWVLSLQDGSFRQLTRSLTPGLGGAAFPMPESVTYPSLDGALVPALLFRPWNANGHVPGVVVVHGGPNWLFQYLWYPVMAHMASRGWAVLAPNYRGSTGYGREWQLASRYDYGGVDAMDVAAGADFLASNGLADPKRIAVTGRSHGGYLTMVALTRYPERWAAGSAVVPFLNWFTAHANSREDLQHWDRENFGDPQADEARWRERSPFFFLERVAAPVQLICGENDPRCPASESIAARDALLALGKTVDFILYGGEGHAFLKRESVVDAEVRRVEFLARWLERD